MDFGSLLYVLFELVIIGLIFYVLWWAVGAIAPPDPIRKVIQVILIVVMVLILLYILFGLAGAFGGFIPHPVLRR